MHTHTHIQTSLSNPLSPSPGVNTEEVDEHRDQTTVQLLPPHPPTLTLLLTLPAGPAHLVGRWAGGVACDDEAEDGLGEEILGD